MCANISKESTCPSCTGRCFLVGSMGMTMPEQTPEVAQMTAEPTPETRRRMNPLAWTAIVGAGAGLFAGLVVSAIGFAVVLDRIPEQGSTVTQTIDVAGDDTVVNVAAQASPAVVSIVASKDMPRYEQYMEQYGLFMMPRYRENGTERREIGAGSGFVISADGYVVTNRHVIVDPEAEYTVITSEGDEYIATVVASDATMDIALLKIDVTDMPYLAFGDSDAVQVGQTVVAIGNALGEFSNTVSVGVVSGLARNITASGGGAAEELQNVIQTDAAINSGNSGGPLLDLNGQVIGVNVAASFGMTENIGFALPANAVQQVVDDLREFGTVQRVYLGVRFTMIDADFAEQNDLSVDYGAILLRGENRELAVIPGSPADKAGLEENDIILAVNGEKLEQALNVALRDFSVGDVVSLKVLHDGEEKTVDVTLGNQPTEKK